MSNKIIRANKEALQERINAATDSALIEYNSLFDYYLETKKALLNKESNTRDNYDYAIKISNLLDELFEEPFETKNEKIKEVENKLIANSIKVNDIFSSITISEDNSGITLSFKKTRINGKTVNPIIGRQKKQAIDSFEKIYVKSILSNIIINFESYLERVLYILILNNPEKYLGAKDIKLRDLLSEEVNSILSRNIEFEITRLLYDSIKTLTIIKDKDNIIIDRFVNISKQFKELYYRRNVYVHNSGCVNEVYLKSVDEEYSSKVKMNDKLVCDDVYIENALIILAKVEFTLFYELINSLGEEYCKMLCALGNIGFEFLYKEEYEIAEHIYLLLSKSKNLERSDLLMYNINYLNALKQQGKIRFDDKEIKQLDVSASESIYKLGKACLENEHEKAYKLIKALLDEEKIGATELTEWPIFIDFRQTDYYEKIKNEYEEKFAEIVFSKNIILEEAKDIQEKD